MLYGTEESNVPLNTLQVISGMIFPASHFTGWLGLSTVSVPDYNTNLSKK